MTNPEQVGVDNAASATCLASDVGYTTMKRTDNPFVGQVDLHFNACIGNYGTFNRLCRHYAESADALVALSLDDTGMMDVHVDAICFLYRHALELRLKDLLWKSKYATQGVKHVPMHHRLSNLWKDLRLNVSVLAGEDIPLSREELLVVADFLGALEKHDPVSDSFRYPYDTDMKRSHPGLVHVHLPTLKNRFHVVDDYICRLYEMVEWHYEQRNEMEAEQRHP